MSVETAMKYKPYPAYKDSGIEWLGEVPEHWKICALKRLLIEPLMYGANEASDDDTPSNPRFVRITDIDTDGKLREDTFRSLPLEVAKPYLLTEGDVLLARSGATVGKSFIYKTSWGVCCFAGYLIRARLNLNSMNPDYLYACCQSSFYWQYINSEQIQATIQNVSAERYGNFVLPLPPIEEQQTIAAFLDRETAKIDTLIAKQERLIDLLGEKRIALISHAVTKGLNSDAPMKESGVEWLGEVPEHWEVKPIKRIASSNDDVLTEKTPDEYEIDYVDISSVNEVDGIIKTEEMIFKNAPSRARRLVKDGDVIVSTVRTYLKAIAPIKSPNENLVVSTGFAVIRPNSSFLPAFAAYLFKAHYLIELIISRSVGVSYPAINSSDLISLKTALPSLKEQQTIATFLDCETTKIDTLITKARRAIDLLKERRTALISAAVTGKIDVREVFPSVMPE